MSEHACPACRVPAEQHTPATDCQIVRDILAYEADVASGKVNEPGYWITLEELEARMAAREAGGA